MFMDDIYDYTEGFKGSNARDLMEYVEKNKRKIEHEEYLKKEPIRQNKEMLRSMQDMKYQWKKSEKIIVVYFNIEIYNVNKKED